MRVAISGSSGLIGNALAAHLRARGDEPFGLSRPLRSKAFEGADAIVHLAGAGIGDKRWSPQRKAEIRSSRIDNTALIAEALARGAGPKILISGSAIGIYGDRGDEVLTESSALPGESRSYLAEVARDWEAATRPAGAAGVRVAHLRTGVVLSRDGGALARMLVPFRLGLGGRIGSGRQWWSWISIDDAVRAIAFLLDHELNGPVNLTAPNPARNADFARALGKALHRPAVLPLPAFAPKLLLGAELAHELLLTSARVEPARLLDAGFAFDHATLDDALRAVLA